MAASKQAAATTSEGPAVTKAATSSTTKKAAVKTPAVKKAPTAKPAGTAPAARTTTAPAKVKSAGKLVVREDESPWTAQELAEVRTELTSIIDRMTAELEEMEQDLAGLIRDSGDGAGDDQADAGTKNFATDYEYTVAQKARESLLQSQHALERLDVGTYGICEACGKPIGKLRLQAFPRATLCMACKQLQERR